MKVKRGVDELVHSNKRCNTYDNTEQAKENSDIKSRYIHKEPR
jgi:hypothetical protein